MDSPGTYTLNFNGQILTRGFWLYVWYVTTDNGSLVYVGRTGDSSSDKASSPFVRISRHLDARANAKANSLYRKLCEKGLDPTKCDFEFVAFGPLFPEQTTTVEHRAFRDRVGALETLLAGELHTRGYDVVGIHHSLADGATEVDIAQLKAFVDTQFPDINRRAEC